MKWRIQFIPVGVSILFSGCSTHDDPCIAELVVPVLGSSPAAERASMVPNPMTANPLVENGDIYRFVELQIPDSVAVIQIPESFIVQQDPNQKNAMIYLDQALFYMGHPNASFSFRDNCERMGLAAQLKGRTLRLATYGHWNTFEGGSGVMGAIVLPEHVRVKRVKTEFELSALEMEARGWSLIQTAPDPNRTYLEFSKQ